MTSDQEYQNTKEMTDQLVQCLTDWLKEKRGGNWEAHEMPKYAPMDYEIYKDNEFMFYLEVKFRRHKRGKYDQEKVPVTKYAFEHLMRKTEKRESFLLVKWEDSLGLINLGFVARIDSMLARKDRGQESDLYAFYNEEKFNALPDVDFMFENRSVLT